MKGTAFYGTGVGRKDMGGVLEWGEESKVFKSILAHPRLVSCSAVFYHLHVLGHDLFASLEPCNPL